jgi:hypothetical protein
MSDIVQKLWGFCHTLRHDGIDYGDYIEQITYLLFLKIADERAVPLPKNCDWPTLRDHAGTELTDHYIDILRKLAKSPGLLGDIYAGAQSRFKNPVNLKRLISLIDETEWTALDVDVKAAAYEGLLEKAASEMRCFSGGTEPEFFCLKVDMRSMAGVDRFASGIGGCDSISETNCRKHGIHNGLWSDNRFRIFSGLRDWPAVYAAGRKTRTSGDVALSTRRRKNSDSCRRRMSDGGPIGGARKSSVCSG